MKESPKSLYWSLTLYFASSLADSKSFTNEQGRGGKAKVSKINKTLALKNEPQHFSV
jgi:hypothetical protein